MTKVLNNKNVSQWVLPLALLVTATANGDPMTFSYEFLGNPAGPPGSKLFGQFDGTADSADSNRVFINSFGTVSLAQPGLALHVFPSIDNSEFNTYPSGDSPVVTFNGAELKFRVCPSGFTETDIETGHLVIDDCPFAQEGGFLIAPATPVPPFPFNFGFFATASDGGGSQIIDFGVAGAWMLATLPDNVDPTVIIDPTVMIGTGSTVDQRVVLEEMVVLGENVFVDTDTSIGAGTTIADFTVIDTNVEIGSNVVIGTNGVTDQNVVIEDGVVIGMNTNIDVGVHICSGVIIGSFVKIGKNNLVTANVPSTGELPDVEGPAGPCP